MPILSINPTYTGSTLLRETHLDSIRTPILDFFNTTKLDSVNIDLQDIVNNLSDVESATLLSIRGLGLNASKDFLTTPVINFTTYADIAEVIVPDSGMYLIKCSGFLRFKSNVVETTNLDSQISYRVWNETTTVAIGPEVLCRYSLDTPSYNQKSLEFSIPINYNYITNLVSGDVLNFQVLKGTTVGSELNSTNGVRLSLMRLLK